MTNTSGDSNDEPTMKRPLAGIRIADLSNVFSLPYASGLLADMGAEVIKIEGPGRVDTTRQGVFSGVHPENDPGEDPWNRTGTFNLINRGKKSLVVDLSKPEGREILKDLIKVSDILMENFTPRVMRNWGLDYPNAVKLNPRLIMASCSGYGRGGPYEQYPAQATTQEATHGLTYVTGYRGDLPSKAGQSFVDFLATWALVMSTLMALRYRNRSGKGLWIDVAMYQLGCYMVSERVMDWEANQRLGERIGNRHPWLAPQGCYRCAGDDAWCVLSVRDDDEWLALCRAIDRTDLIGDPRFASNAGRMAHHDEIDGIISAWTRLVTKYEAMERLQQAGVPAGAVFDVRDMHLDPHVRSHGLLETVEFPPERHMGKRRIIGRPWRFSRTKLSIRGPAPMLGQHNREVLQGILGYSAARCDELEQAGLIGTKPTAIRPMAHLPMEDRIKQGRLAAWDQDYRQRLGLDEP